MNLLNGNLNLTYLNAKNCANINTDNSDTVHTIDEPKEPNDGTINIFNKTAITALIRELIKTALSLRFDKSTCITIICSYPIIKTNGLITLRQGTAFSYPFPDIK